MSESMDRLLLAAKQVGLNSAAEIARALNIGDQATTNWRARKVPGSAAAKLQAMFGISAAYVIEGTPPMLVNASSTTPMPEGAIHVGNERARPIYVVGKGAGSPAPERIWTDGDRPVGAIDDFVMGYSSDPEAFLIEVDGSSMYPKYEHGNFALIEPNTSIDLEDVVLVRQEDGRTLLKRLLSRRNGKIVLASYNDPARIELDDLDVSWMYYAANEIARKKIKTRF